jgi:hypothetical protein
MQTIVGGITAAVTLLLIGMLAWNAEAAPREEIERLEKMGYTCKGNGIDTAICTKGARTWHCSRTGCLEERAPPPPN